MSSRITRLCYESACRGRGRAMPQARRGG